MQLATKLCGTVLEHPLMNAAGTCKTLDQVGQFARSAVSAIVVGSITVEQRDGSQGTVYHPDPGGGFSLNALGLPNPGAEYYDECLPAMVHRAESEGKRLIVSVAGFSPEEYAQLASLAYNRGAWKVELNLGCPNVWGDDGQKPIASFNPEMVRAIIKAVASRLPADGFGVKLSPLSNPLRLEEVAAVITESVVEFVTTSNTFPNAFAFDACARHAAISVGYGGMAGTALKPIALGQVRQLRALLPESVDIIGAGGVTSPIDIFEFRRLGATAVQAATAYWNANENPRAYGDILEDADDLFEVEIVR